MDIYNNLGITVIAIHATISIADCLPLSKVMLIMPFYAHKSLTDYLAKKNVEVMSIEHLISMKTDYFSNFNDRFIDLSVQTIHAVQFLIASNIVKLKDGVLYCLKPFVYSSKTGRRAKKIDKASRNMAKILDEESSKLYLNLRVLL